MPGAIKPSRSLVRLPFTACLHQHTAYTGAAGPAWSAAWCLPAAARTCLSTVANLEAQLGVFWLSSQVPLDETFNQPDPKKKLQQKALGPFTHEAELSNGRLASEWVCV